MKPSTLLRTFSSKLSARLSPSSVAPWPPVRTTFDWWLTSELDDLRIHPNLYATSAWLAKSLDAAVSAQQAVIDSVSSSQGAVDTNVFDGYLDDTIDLLDACNVVRQRIEEIRTYIDSLAIVLHCLEGVHEPSSTAVRRAQAVLDSCAGMEKRCAELDTCGSNLRKLGEKLALQDRKLPSSELQEVLTGSRALAVLTISMCNIALSFRSRRGVPMVPSSKNSSSWANSMFEIQKEAKEEYDKRRKDGGSVLEELKATVSTVQKLRRSLREREGEVRDIVRELRRRFEELEEGVRPLEEGVDGLYRRLIDVRMCLLRVISEA